MKPQTREKLLSALESTGTAEISGSNAELGEERRAGAAEQSQLGGIQPRPGEGRAAASLGLTQSQPVGRADGQ